RTAGTRGNRPSPGRGEDARRRGRHRALSARSSGRPRVAPGAEARAAVRVGARVRPARRRAGAPRARRTRSGGGRTTPPERPPPRRPRTRADRARLVLAAADRPTLDRRDEAPDTDLRPRGPAG